MRSAVDYHPKSDDCSLADRVLKEYYMVQDKLWRRARRWPVDRNQTKLPRTATLCIGCLEARLGKRLAPSDFQYVFDPRSQRLQDRTKSLDPIPAASGEAKTYRLEDSSPE